MEAHVDTTVHSPQCAFAAVQAGNWEAQREEIQLGEQIGEGANAVIRKATFRGKVCAAKMLKKGVTTNSQAYKDLITELEILTSVTQHPNVVKLLGAVVSFADTPTLLEVFFFIHFLLFLQFLNRCATKLCDRAVLSGAGQ